MTPLQASSMALNRVQQYAMASMRAATNTQEVIDRIFSKIQDDYEKAEIKRASVEVRNSKEGKNHAYIMEAAVGGARANRFKSIFKDEYKGTMYYKDAGEVGYEYYNTLPQ